MNAVIETVTKGLKNVLNSFFKLNKLELYGTLGDTKNKIGANLDITIFGMSVDWTAVIDLNNIADVLWDKCKEVYKALGNIGALLEAEWNKIKNVVSDAFSKAKNHLEKMATDVYKALGDAAKKILSVFEDGADFV